MVTLNKHRSVLAAISVIFIFSDDSDVNFVYILSANECQQRNVDSWQLCLQQQIDWSPLLFTNNCLQTNT